MASNRSSASPAPPPSIHVVSGGAGASGELLLRTALAQFERTYTPVLVRPYIHTPEQAVEVVALAAAENALLVHTLVDHDLRHLLIAETEANHVAAVDLIGPLLEELAARLGEEPLGHPGRYRATRNGYFKRIEAMEFAVNHDDGQRIGGLDQAEIVLLGVSRVGKTPLSIYLSLQGWKVANLPMVMGIAPPAELLQVNAAKVVGLTIEPQQLLIFRRARQKSLGIPPGGYVDRIQVAEELRAANHFFARQGYAVIDVTDKPIETSSEEVIALISERVLQA